VAGDEALNQPLVRRAAELANEAHAHQRRKGNGVPYVSHLESVARRLIEHGYDDETTLAAAWLHDLLEDQPAYAARLRADFPAAVVETVEALSETKRDAHGRELEKSERFAGYVAGLMRDSEAVRRALPISCADKVDNLTSLAGGRDGNRLLWRMRTRPGDQEPHLRTLRRLYAPVVNATLLGAFDDATRAVLEVVEAGLLNRALSLAAEAHLGQRDEAGAPYVLKPMRLMLRAETLDEKLVGALHGVLEDSTLTAPMLAREGFPRRIVRAIERLTRNPGEDYETFIERVAGDGLAARVKLLELEEDTHLARTAEPNVPARERVEDYERAMERLRPVVRRRSLFVTLDEASRRRLRDLAVYPELHADHVTLAFCVSPEDFSAAWIPGGAAVGDTLAFATVAHAENQRVQAVLVEIAGRRERPFDGGPLHVTVSATAGARAVESNALFEAGAPSTPLELTLSGTVRWFFAP
jgi:hypothetical protein